MAGGHGALFHFGLHKDIGRILHSLATASGLVVFSSSTSCTFSVDFLCVQLFPMDSVQLLFLRTTSGTLLDSKVSITNSVDLLPLFGRCEHLYTWDVFNSKNSELIFQVQAY